MKTYNAVMRRTLLVLLALAVVAAGLGVAATQPAGRAWLEGQTGEQQLGAQVRAMWNRTLDLTRPPLNLAANAAIAPRVAEVRAINTFLHQEVEPAKRARQLEMARAAGFTWIRQPFPWYDLEVHGKGDFTDRRNGPAQDAWAKYDNIVALAEQAGMRIIARLEAPPEWAHRGYKDLGTLGPPADFADYADFVAAVVTRYRGRIAAYQLWNEPNIYPEWGEQGVNPEDYARMLCLAAARVRAVDGQALVLAAALAPTVAQSGRDLSDLIFLQRMYNAGAGKCFDVAAAQGYGLFSGPDDRRMSPLSTNVARHTLMRDIMVSNGDAQKPVWLAEANWNALPAVNDGIAGYGNFGIVSQAEQARYLPRLYSRAEAEWPWVGVVAVWYLKPASDAEKKQAVYYFRLLEPDFTPLPVYDALKATFGPKP